MKKSDHSDSESVTEKKINHWWLNPTAWGWVLTTLIVVLIATYMVYKPNAFKSLLNDANEVGDFLAGTAGTLALVWLIVGYFLQRQELKQNTSALNDQKIELANQVIESNKMAKAMVRMAKSNESLVKFYESVEVKQIREKMEQVKPIFRSGGGGSFIKGGTSFKIENAGESINNLKINVETNYVEYFDDIKPYFDKGDHFTLNWSPKGKYDWPLKFSVEYLDTLGNGFTETFEIHPGHKLKQIRKLPLSN